MTVSEAKRNEMRRSETELLPEAAAMAAPSGGRCKRAGCPAPLPPQESGRARQLCSDEWRGGH